MTTTKRISDEIQLWQDIHGRYPKTVYVGQIDWLELHDESRNAASAELQRNYGHRPTFRGANLYRVDEDRHFEVV